MTVLIKQKKNFFNINLNILMDEFYNFYISEGPDEQHEFKSNDP